MQPAGRAPAPDELSIASVLALTRTARLRALFPEIFYRSPVPVTLSLLEDGSFIEINDAWMALFGFTREEVLGKTRQDLNLWVSDEQRQRLGALVRAPVGATGVETQARKKNGEICDLLLSSEIVDYGNERCLLMTVHDITGRKRDEAQRRLVEERFAKVFLASPVPIVISRIADGRYVEVNDVWLEQFGYRRENIIGRSSVELGVWVDPAERVAFVERVRADGAVRHFEARLRRRSGEVANTLLSAEAIDLEGVPSLVICVEDVTERKRAERHIEHLATRDHLTGLPNRVLFGDRLQHALAKSERDGSRVALMFIDLDRFKDINDSMGHQAGDRLLIEVAGRLNAVMRTSDSVARQGGDEFLVLIEGLADGREAEPVARKLVDYLAEPFRIEDRLHSVSSSIGLAIYPDDADNAEDLMRNADIAMYSVKESGRNGFRFFSSDMNQRLQMRMDTETRLRGALARDELTLHYQPKIDMASRRVVGCEALLRWNVPHEGLLLPDDFISIAEDTRLVVPIGEWVIRRACEDIAAWRAMGRPLVPVAVNLSVHQFNAELPRVFSGALADNDLSPELIEVEITETVMMQDTLAHLNVLRRLKEVGLQIAIDDFGVGYSSLNYLRQMEVDTLKIDRSFVRNLTASANDRTIVAAIIALAGQFGMKTIAEGVETQAQFDTLKRMNCRECQGYLFSGALPAEEFAHLYLPVASPT